MTFFLVACPTFDQTLAFDNQEMEGAQGRAGWEQFNKDEQEFRRKI
jgi:hypothetical protein